MRDYQNNLKILLNIIQKQRNTNTLKVIIMVVITRPSAHLDEQSVVEAGQRVTKGRVIAVEREGEVCSLR